MNPREQLTTKARAGILKYATLEGERQGMYHHFMVNFVLKAERMRREQLYAWLDKKGYTWNSKRGYWVKK